MIPVSHDSYVPLGKAFLLAIPGIPMLSSIVLFLNFCIIKKIQKKLLKTIVITTFLANIQTLLNVILIFEPLHTIYMCMCI